MFHLILGVTAISMGIFGLMTNLYILLVLILSSKTKSSGEWVLIHLSSCGLGSSLLILIFSCPSILLKSWISPSSAFCDSIGAIFLDIQLLSVWSICALSADRSIAIRYPLRYTQIVTRKRIFFYFLFIWVLSIVIVFTAFLVSPHPINKFPINSTLEDKSESPMFMGEGDTEQFKFQFHDQFQFFPLLRRGEAESDTFIPITKSIISTTTSLSDSSSSSSESWSFEKNLSQYDTDETENTTDERVQVLVNDNASASDHNSLVSYGGHSFVFRPVLGLCLPKVSPINFSQTLWTCEWVIFILIAPTSVILVCDLIVLSIARKQRHRIVMALYQVTLSAQATVTRSKGNPPPPSLWLNQTVPPRSRACRALWEDLLNLFLLNFPFILILIVEIFIWDHSAPSFIVLIATVAFSSGPTVNALLYGVRARPLRTAYKSYLRKRLTKSTLVHEIQQRLSPVDNSPRPSSRAKSYRSATPSQNSSPLQTPRRCSTHELRPPEMQFFITSSPSHENLGRNASNGGHNHNHLMSTTARRVRSFLNLPFQNDMQEFWSGLRRPNRSPTIVITHEFRSTSKDSPQQSPVHAEQRL